MHLSSLGPNIIYFSPTLWKSLNEIEIEIVVLCLCVRVCLRGILRHFDKERKVMYGGCSSYYIARI